MSSGPSPGLPHMTEVFATDIRWGSHRGGTTVASGCATGVAGEILVFDDDGGRSVARVEGLPFSIDWLPDGRLVATTPDGVVAGPDLAPYGAAGRPFNEIVVDGAGRVWVDMPGAMPWEEPKPGIVGVVLPDGTYREAAGDVWFPNGMVVLDDDTLVLAESHADRLTAWTISSDGELTDRRVWADLGPGAAPDGICADAEGAIWYASVPGQRCSRVAEGGRELERVEVDRGCFACMLGGTTVERSTSWRTTTVTRGEQRTGADGPGGISAADVENR